MIELLLLVPLVLSLVAFVVRSRRVSALVLVGYALLHLAISIQLVRFGGAFTRYFEVDAASALFLLLLSVVVLAVSVYVTFYFAETRAQRPANEFRATVVFLLLFVDSINGVLLSTNLGLLWVFLEASTLTSVALVNLDRRPASLEAAWKYVFICSIGISLAFIGIIFLSIGGQSSVASLFFVDLERGAPGIARVWLELAFPFIVIGFGTKMGLAPVHSWLPDAHSEAPAPISALLSGALLNAALFGILRVMRIMSVAGLGRFGGTLLAVMGFLSMFVSAVFILGARNYKRMLAYSSIENMGIISVGVGIGGAGIFAALVHVIGHSLAKSSFFLNAGNVYHHTRSRETSHSTGMFTRDAATAWLWLASFIAIVGIPPFVTFLSELLLVKRLLAVSVAATLVFLALLLVAVFGMARSVLQIVAGSKSGSPQAAAGAPVLAASSPDRAQLPPATPTAERSRLPLHAYLPQVALLAAAALLGISMPQSIAHLVQAAARTLGGSP